MKKIFEDESKLKTAKNIKFNVQVLKRYGVNLNGLYFDTNIAAHLLNPLTKSISLTSLSIEYLNYEMVSTDNLFGRGKKQISVDQVELNKIAFYSSEQADIALQLTHLLDKKLKFKLEKFNSSKESFEFSRSSKASLI